MEKLTFEDVELAEVGNGISFVGTVWHDSVNDKYYVLPCNEDLEGNMDNLACFEFSNLEKYKFINQAWLLESRRYTGYKEKALKVALYRSQSSIEPAIKWQVFRRDNFTCQYCGWDRGEMTYDHIIPVSHGGSTTIENGKTACRPCNKGKGDMSVEEWLASDRLKRLCCRKLRLPREKK